LLRFATGNHQHNVCELVYNFVCHVKMLEMIKAIVFDADGVIVRPQTFFVARANKLYGVPKQEFMAFIHGQFKRCTTGELELLDILPEYLVRWNVSVEPRVFVRQWVEHEHHIDTALLEKIQVFRANGIPCYLGTNQERNRADYMKLEMGFNNSLDGVFASSDLGFRKPDLEFYKSLQNKIQLSASEILFWDDSLENVTAAREAGWNSEVFNLSRFGHLRTFDATMKRYRI
jgi:putative hydrolase of the HAD superfamily